MRKLLPFLILLSACTTLHSTPQTRAVVKSAPKWYAEPPRSNDYVYGVAMAESEDMHFAVEMSQSLARAQIGRQLDVKFGDLQKRFQEQTRVTDGADILQQFSNAYTQVTSEFITAAQVKEQKIIPGRNVYVVYALVEMPIGEANRLFIENVRNRQTLYTRMRATEMYKELNAAVNKLDSLKTP